VVVVLALVAVQPSQAQLGSATGLPSGGVSFAPMNPVQSGFNPMSFFHNMRSMFQWPPQVNITNQPLTGPNPFPKDTFKFPTKNIGQPGFYQLPSMQVQTSFGP